MQRSICCVGLALLAVFAAAGVSILWPTALLAHQRTSSQVRAGESIALSQCAVCHVAASNQPIPPMLNQPTKTFQQIANNPATTAKGLRRFIMTTHWDEQSLPMTMPNPGLLDEEAEQVSAYILSLRQGPAPTPPPSARVSRSDRHVEAGEYVALSICSYCHVVSADARYRPGLKQPTPSFQEIADRPGTTRASLRRFIKTTHWDEKSIPMTMPDPLLEPNQLDDVASYILSLRRSRDGAAH